MNFLKWPSIENTYQEQRIQLWVDRFPSLVNLHYVVTEKLDGSNIQWCVDGENVRFGSRNNWVSGSFQGASVDALYEEHKSLLEGLKRLSVATGRIYRLFGELIGHMKRVDYGSERRVLYFGLMINDVLLPFDEFEDAMYSLHSTHLIVPIVKVCPSLEDALKVSPDFESRILNKEGNMAEGVVIQPRYHTIYWGDSGNSSVFVLKNKSEHFKESPQPKEKKEVDEGILSLHKNFLEYVNDPRIQSVFSKEGVIESPKDMGKYIRLIMQDAIEDFEKDFDVSSLEKSELKLIYNVGGIIADMLKGYL